MLTRRKQDVLGPGGAGVGVSRREGEGLLDLEQGDCAVSAWAGNRQDTGTGG